MANFELQTKWFAESVPQNAKSATSTIGSGDNGTVVITVDNVGTEGNDYTVEVKEGAKASVSMSATLVDGAIVVTLGTDELSVLDDTKNTAILIATAINSLPGISAYASNTGETALTLAEAEANFTGGQYGTVAPVPYTMLQDETYYYVNIAPNGKTDANWRRFSLSQY